MATDWRRVNPPDSLHYFYNISTSEVVWKMPEGIDEARVPVQAARKVARPKLSPASPPAHDTTRSSLKAMLDSLSSECGSPEVPWSAYSDPIRTSDAAAASGIVLDAADSASEERTSVTLAKSMFIHMVLPSCTVTWAYCPLWCRAVHCRSLVLASLCCLSQLVFLSRTAKRHHRFFQKDGAIPLRSTGSITQIIS